MVEARMDMKMTTKTRIRGSKTIVLMLLFRQAGFVPLSRVHKETRD